MKYALTDPTSKVFFFLFVLSLESMELQRITAIRTMPTSVVSAHHLWRVTLKKVSLQTGTCIPAVVISYTKSLLASQIQSENSLYVYKTIPGKSKPLLEQLSNS